MADLPTPTTIGVFDSGIGGFTVASAILKQRPDLNLLYYADSVNLPYGGRDPEQLQRFVHNICEFLREQGATLIADGCNTVSMTSSEGLRAIEHMLPVYDLIESTYQWLRTRRKPEGIALLATQATVNAGLWADRFSNRMEHRSVHDQGDDTFHDVKFTAIAAPELVPLIEAPQQDEQALRAAVGKYTRLIQETEADTVIYGCTHYPLLHSLFVELDVYKTYVDPSKCIAERIVEVLGPAPEGAPAGTLRFFNSKPSERFYTLGEQIFGQPIRDKTRYYIVNPHES